MIWSSSPAWAWGSDVIPDKKTGDKLYASEIDELADSARLVQGLNIGGMNGSVSPAGISLRLPSSTKIIREAAVSALALNLGETDLPAYGVCGITGHGPAGDDAHSTRIFTVRTPVAAEDTNWFGITAEPIPAQGAGRIYLAGVCLARVLNPDSQWYLEVADGQSYLAGAASGSAQKLWEDTVDLGGGVHLALVRFPGAGAAQTQMFKVVSVEVDYIVCHAWDGETEGQEAVLVALPYLLRMTPFDGQTRDGITYDYDSEITRTATKDADTEDQVIVPSYIAGDVIFAATGIIGGTDATGPNSEVLDRQDLNVDGRAWAKVAE